MQSYKDTFLSVVKLGIDHSATSLPQSTNWQEVSKLAELQGLYAVVLDGIEKLPASVRTPREMLLEWIGEVLQEYEYRFEQYEGAISSLAGFYNSHGYKMMVLKGYACCLDWPKPSHRPCGDIDIWLFGKQKEADEALRQAQGLEFKIDKSHHHHTVFNWGEFTVENHYDFVNVHARRSSAEMEKVFKELGGEANLNFDHNDNLGTKKGCKIFCVEVNGEKVYLPSPNLHALFLIKHNASHFVGSNITLRQVLDWAFFVEKHTDEIDWAWLNGMIEKYHMSDFVNCLNAICVEDLGFDAGIFHRVLSNPRLKDRILADILFPKYATEEPKHLIPRLVYKYKRWQGNGWKHKLCYNESRWSSFWTGIWAKILKPASI